MVVAVDLAGPHALAEIFQVHLMADAGARRHHAEVVECVLAPAEEPVALAVALELDVHVPGQRVGTGEHVDLHRVVDHQIHRHQRVDLPRIAAEPGDAVAHRRQIDHRGNAGEILQQDARGLERHLLVGVRRGEPAGDRLGIIDRVAGAVLEAQHVLQQHLQADRQARYVAQRLRRLGEREVVVALALHGEGAASLQGVLPGRFHGGAFR